MPTLKQNEALNARAVGRLERAAARNILQTYQVALADMRKGMGILYERYSTSGALTMAEMSKFNRLKSMHDNILKQMGPRFASNGRTVERMSEAIFTETYYREGWAISQDVKADINWGLLHPEVVKAAVQNPISGLTLHGLTLEERRRTLLGINRAVTQGLVQDDSYPKMMRRVKGFLEGDAKRAMTVVRTEGQRAMVEGQIAAGEEAERLGVETRKVWDATLDGATRPEHGALDGQPANADGLFDTAVGLVRGPLSSGDPSFDINCRCRVSYEVVGYEPTSRRIRDEGVVPYKTYRQWAQDKPKILKQLNKVAV